MSTVDQHKPPLGVFAILQEAFGLLLNRFFPIAILALAVTVFQVGFEMAITPDVADPLNFNFTVMAIGLIGSLVLLGIQSSVLTGIAYEAKLGRPADLMSYVKIGLAIVVPLFLVLILVGLAIVLGLLLLVLPGLYLMAMFAVVVPAMVIERAGFGAISRSSELTQGYRWPILGYTLLVFIIIFVISIPLALIGGTDPFATPNLTVLFVTTLIVTFVSSVFGLGTALIYARLREIKEGVGLQDLAKVFE